jgi:hypothetical protein
MIVIVVSQYQLTQRWTKAKATFFRQIAAKIVNGMKVIIMPAVDHDCMVPVIIRQNTNTLTKLNVIENEVTCHYFLSNLLIHEIELSKRKADGLKMVD